MRRAYTNAFRAKVMETYEAEGLAAAAREHGVPRGTVSWWAKKAGLTGHQSEIARDGLAARLERIKEKLGRRAEEMLDRMDEPMVSWTGSGKNAVRIELPRPPAGVCREFATTAAILIDKLQLLRGEPTERHEHTDTAGDIRERLNSRIAGIAAARGAGAAAERPD